MATFIKCKHDSVAYKNHKKEQFDYATGRFLLFFKTKVPLYRPVPEDKVYINNPINIDLVLNIEKISGLVDTDASYNFVNPKPGIKFDWGKYYENWYYSSEKARDEQFEEIANNIHSYKTKVSL